jgi:teichoic acid transport system permease protein
MAGILSQREPRVYEATATGLPPLRPYLRDAWSRRPLLWHLARTDLKAEHYSTVLGQIWIVLDPLLMAAVYFLLRTVVRPAGDAASRDALISHLLWAVFFFMFTAKTIQAGSRSLLAGKALVLNTSVPRVLLPTTAVLKGFLDFLPTLLVYLIFHAVLGQPFTVWLVFLPLLVLMQTVLNFGAALGFAPLMVLFRDTGAFLPYITRIWLYTTPVLFTVSEIPENMVWLFRWNPLYPLVGALEQIFGGSPPSPAYLAAFGAWSLVFFVVGSLVFLSNERSLAIRL